MLSRASRSRAPALPLRHRRPRGKGPAIVDLDVALARKPSNNTGRRRTGKNAKAADTSVESAVAKSTNVAAADTSVESAVAKSTYVTGKAAKAAAEKAVSAEKLTLEDADDFGNRGDVGPLKKRKRSARVAADKDAKAAAKAQKDTSKAASMAATDEHPTSDDDAAKSWNSVEKSVATNVINKKVRAPTVAPAKGAKAAAEASPDLDDDPNNDALTVVSLSWSISFEIVN